MSTTPKKPAGTNGTTGPSKNTTTPDRTAADNRTATTKSSNGLQRTPSGRASPVSARAAARKPGRSNLSVSSVPKIASPDASSFDDDARAQNAALIDELKEQLQKAETASEQYQKQLGVLQSRLDDAITEQQKLEDQVHERDSNIEALNVQIRDHARQLRDMEQAHEQERKAMLQDKEQQASREEELQSTIQRLKESIAQKDIRVNTDSDKSNISRSCMTIPTPTSIFYDSILLTFSQRVSEIGLPQTSTVDNSLHRPKSNAARHETMPSFYCKRTS